MKPKLVAPVGQKFARLIIESGAESAKNGDSQCWCRCDCGARYLGRTRNVLRGATKSCGCHRVDVSRVLGAATATHGHTRTGVRSPEFVVWSGMIQRCKNPSYRGFHNYGGRGISVAAAWQGDDGFERFLAHVGPRPSPRHSLDRFPNNNGNYEPGNVRWATAREQHRNKRTNHMLTLDGTTLPAVVWAERLNMNPNTLYNRLALGWSDKRVLTEPVRRKAA